MKMLGTNLCPICVDAEAKLKEHGIDIQYSDFANSIVSLKEFIHFRDTHSEFETAKKNSKIGIPCFVFDDGYITFDIDEAIKLASIKD